MSSTYRKVLSKGHVNSDVNGQVYGHVLVMSEILGRPLAAGEVVHHRDENRGNNTPGNLQLFASHAEHHRHHAEERALAASGNRLFMKCKYCKEYDNPISMHVEPKGYIAWHQECNAQYQRNLYQLRKKKQNEYYQDAATATQSNP